MKEFWYAELEDYVQKADKYDNPKTIKMFEVQIVDQPGKKLFRAVTYLRTALIGFQRVIAETAVEDFAVTCGVHGHERGVILEVGRIE